MVCQACGIEEAKNKVSLYLCTSDLDIAMPIVRSAMEEIRRKVGESQKETEASEEQE